METCADCGKPIVMNAPSYYRADPAGGMGKSYHSTCGDPLGIKAKDAEIAEWRQAAGVEAGLRREFLARAESAEAVLRRVIADWDQPQPTNLRHGRHFLSKETVAEARAIVAALDGAARNPATHNPDGTLIS